jgi:F0F1-type ATP synthase membrane subunit c/vacuolar-type H+-ATPase subunit K
MGVGSSTGVAIGAAFGIALENIGAGIVVGLAIGSGIGAWLEQRNKDKVRPLTEQEKRIQKWAMTVGLASLLILAGLLIVLVFLRIR